MSKQFSFFFEVCDEFIFMKKTLFKNVFDLDQYVFGLVRGSINQLDNIV